MFIGPTDQKHHPIFDPKQRVYDLYSNSLEYCTSYVMRAPTRNTQ